MKYLIPSGIVGLMLVLSMTGCESGGGSIALTSGWAIGWDQNQTAVILHTGDGLNWNVQGDTSLWTGHSGTDISAVDYLTAWAVLASSVSDFAGGLILHTTDGGTTWCLQTLPVLVPEGMKGIKGVSRNEAWAVGLRGPVLHTVNGGQTWTVISTGDVTFQEVNRMDVLGNDIWIADHHNGDTGIVHSPDNGQTWRYEQLPSVQDPHGPMTMSIVNSKVAWTTVNGQGDIYRTQDGGVTWKMDASEVVGGLFDIDDLCAVSENEAWFVQNLSSSGGYVMRISIGGTIIKKGWNLGNYAYEGVSAFDESTAWIVGFKSSFNRPDLPDGSILYTSDGETWTSQPLPVSNVALWKISIVGARR